MTTPTPLYEATCLSRGFDPMLDRANRLCGEMLARGVQGVWDSVGGFARSLLSGQPRRSDYALVAPLVK